MDAIVLAGGRIRGALADQEGASVKALLRLDGRTLLERTLSGLRGSRRVERVCVVGPDEARDVALRSGADLFVPEGGTGIDNLLRGMDELGADGRVLCCASDLPLITADDIDDLIARTPPDAQLGYVAFSRSEWQAAFPGGHSSFIPFSDGDFAGSGALVLDAALLRRIEPIVQKAFELRKSAAGMAGLFGVGLTLRFLLGLKVHRSLGPSTESVRRRTERLLGCRCAIVRGCSPRLMADVDDLDDWRYVREEAIKCA
jgi:molybdopterin-guanine dinucleotide biosynthesis protein A